MSQDQPPETSPRLLELEPEEAAALPLDAQDALYRELRDLEPELLSGEPEEVEAYLGRKSEWFRRYIAVSHAARAQPIAPASRPSGRQPKT